MDNRARIKILKWFILPTVGTTIRVNKVWITIIGAHDKISVTETDSFFSNGLLFAIFFSARHHLLVYGIVRVEEIKLLQVFVHNVV